jgi:hypothetical protein
MSRMTYLVALLVFFLLVVASVGQNDGRIHLPPLVQHGQDTRNIPVKSADEMDRERAQKSNELRQAEIRRDADRLAQLSAELKDNLEKADPNLVSVDMFKKAETIEKLAHRVKQKMKEIAN